jgi:hypothetical protein
MRGGRDIATPRSPTGMERPSDEEMLQDEMPDSIDNLRTMIRTSASGVAIPMGAIVPPRAASSFGPPPVAPTFGAPPLPAGAPKPFVRTERSIPSDLIPQARGHAPVAIVAPAPLYADPPTAPQPYRVAPAPDAPAQLAPPPQVAPFVPFAPVAPVAPRAPTAAPASSLRGSRGLLVGLAFGVTIVGVMVVAYALLIR